MFFVFIVFIWGLNLIVGMEWDVKRDILLFVFNFVYV